MRKLFHLSLVILISSCAVSKSTKTIHPFTGDTVGCGNMIIYKLTETKDEYVSVIVDVTSIDLMERQSYGIDKTAVVKVKRKKFNSDISGSLCNDVMVKMKPGELLEEVAMEGVVQVLVSEYNLEKAENKEPYRVTVVLRNVVFESVTIDYLRLEDINVGWLPG